MRKRSATCAVALTFGSVAAALLARVAWHGHPTTQDRIEEGEQAHGATPEDVGTPTSGAPPWTDEVHALLCDQFWELHQEARAAAGAARRLPRSARHVGPHPRR